MNEKYWLVTTQYTTDWNEFRLVYTETITTKGSLVDFLNEACEPNTILLNHLEITEEEWREHKTSEICKRERV